MTDASHSSLGIGAVAHYVPDAVLDNDVLHDRFGFETDYLDGKIGIRERRISAPDQATSDLAVEAVRALMAKTGLVAEDVDCLFLVTQSPDYVLPHVGALVQDRLGLAKSIPTMDINLGCSGFVYGLSSMIPFMQAQGLRRGLLVTSEQYSRHMDPGDRATAPLFGDGAAATLISDDPAYVLGASSFGTDGSGAEALIVHGSGTRQEDRQPLFMSGRGIFEFVMRTIPGSIDACLERNGLTRDDIDCWVFHQASRYMLESLAKRMRLPMDRVVIDLADIGNTTSSTIPIAMERTVLSRADLPDRVFIGGFGVGLSWANSVLFKSEGVSS